MFIGASQSEWFNFIDELLTVWPLLSKEELNLTDGDRSEVCELIEGKYNLPVGQIARRLDEAFAAFCRRLKEEERVANSLPLDESQEAQSALHDQYRQF